MKHVTFRAVPPFPTTLLAEMSCAVARAAKQRIAGAQTEKHNDYYKKQCTSLARQIEAVVYEFCSPTEDEIEIVEGEF